MKRLTPPLRFVFINGRNAGGKDTQADLLINGDKTAFKISPGQLLRDSENPAHPYHKHFRKYLDYLVDGKLVNPDLLTGILSRIVDSEIRRGKRTIIFTGYPREARSLQLMELHIDHLKGRGHRVSKQFVLIDIDEEHSRERNTQRNANAEALGLPIRADDTPEGLEKRLATFSEQTLPLLDRLNRMGRLIVVDGRGAVSETQRELRGALRWKMHSSIEGNPQNPMMRR